MAAMYKIEWTPRAFRQLRKIHDGGEQRRIYDAVDGLRQWPHCGSVKALQGREGYRLRVGRWRVMFDVHDSLRIIEVEEVKRRDEHTY